MDYCEIASKNKAESQKKNEMFLGNMAKFSKNTITLLRYFMFTSWIYGGLETFEKLRGKNSPQISQIITDYLIIRYLKKSLCQSEKSVVNVGTPPAYLQNLFF